MHSLVIKIWTKISFSRLDDDCNSEEICQGVTCKLGCRSSATCSENQACINNKCTDPCASKPCGANALCSVGNHQALCSCPAGKETVFSKLFVCFSKSEKNNIFLFTKPFTFRIDKCNSREKLFINSSKVCTKAPSKKYFFFD